MTSLARIVTGPDDAPTLVLLHGITGSAVSLAEAIDHWVGRGYRVVAVDARGHGLSPRWESAELERAGEVLVEDLIAVLEELEAASRGLSFGAPTETETALASAVRERVPFAQRVGGGLSSFHVVFDVAQVPYLKRLANATATTIKLSITLSMCINFVAIVLSLMQELNPTTGALVHNAGSCFVVLIAALLYDRKFD